MDTRPGFNYAHHPEVTARYPQLPELERERDLALARLTKDPTPQNKEAWREARDRVADYILRNAGTPSDAGLPKISNAIIASISTPPPPPPPPDSAPYAERYGAHQAVCPRPVRRARRRPQVADWLRPYLWLVLLFAALVAVAFLMRQG